MNCTRRLTIALMLTLVAAGLTVAAAPGPVRVGELELIDIGTPAPYPIGSGADAMSWTVRFPEASYIRLHFSKFDLAPGDFVEISNPAGTQSFRFTGMGPHHNGNFWASTIFGDTAIVRLQSFTGGSPGFEIDSFGRGTDPGFLEPPDPGEPGEPESVCGTNDWRDVKCYENDYPTEYENARASVKALIGCCSACTAFKISDSGQFMTNNHCTSSQSGVQSTELQMEYQNNACGGGGSAISGSVFGQDLVATGYTLDYTLMTTTGSSDSIPCVGLDDRLAPAGERIYIAGHPSGGVKKLSLESTHSSNPSGFCEVDGSPVSGRGAGSDIGYYCDTTNGSSGSPVISGDTHLVVGLHHFGGCQNSGGRSDLIINEIGGQIDTCSNGGNPAECGNGVQEGGEECDGGDFGGQTCQSRGFDGGNLACNTDCTIDDSGCTTDPGGGCQLLQKGDSCTSDSECCSNKCRGKRGRRSCR